MSVPQNIQELANKVRNEIYGRDVRESIAKSMEATGEVAEWSRQVAQDIVDGKFDEGELATEIERKLNDLETQYAPQLTQLGEDLAQTMEKPNPKDKAIPLLATGETGSLNLYYNYIKYNNLNHSLLSKNTSRNVGWLKATSTESALTLKMPTGVIIGDSIAEGHKDLHGRLHPNATNAFDPDYKNEEGQLAYELGVLTGVHIYNHGIGGQTTTQVWERWRRDVLAETFDAGDGRGDKTLDEKPLFVFVNVGVNDVSFDHDEEATKENLVNMAKSARDNKIIAIFNNIPPNNIDDTLLVEKKERLNNFIAEELPKYGAVVIDTYTWGLNPSTGIGVNSLYYGDGVHPNKAGYKSLARYMINQCVGLPIFLKGLVLESVTDPLEPLDRLARVVSLEYTSGTVTETEDLVNSEQAFLSLRLKGESPLVDLKPTQYETVTGAGTYAGFSKVKAIMTTTPSNENIITSTSVDTEKKTVYVRRSGTQSIPTDTWTKIRFGLFTPTDTDMFDVNTPEIITIKKTADYLINFNVLFAGNSSGIRGLRLVRNDGKVLAKEMYNNTGDVSLSKMITYWSKMVLGQTLSVEVYQNSGVDLGILGVNTLEDQAPFISIIEL